MSTREQRHTPGPGAVPRPAPAPSASPARPGPSGSVGSPTLPGSAAFPAAPLSGSRPGTLPPAPPTTDTVSEVVRWAAFSCVLVPVVLLWYGTSLAGAAGTALGLAAVTGACLVLLRQSERGAALLTEEHRDASRSRARQPAPQQRGRHGRTVPGSVAEKGRWSGTRAGSEPRGRSGAGVHRGGRHSAGSQSVD
ncbi:hypothetical protein [Streptomyces sp. NPDC002580]|uniref:hypothetical protein n=1 Tax=Streptomyces sp. NPDC002580 TaxID=3364653 RepID=UPI0036CEC044